jgi:hypothetical protein
MAEPPSVKRDTQVSESRDPSGLSKAELKKIIEQLRGGEPTLVFDKK